MSQTLISLNADLKRLRDEGYEIEVRHGHLLMYSVPYVNANKEVKLGTLISELSLAGDVTTTPQTHVIHFQGEYPCSQHGIPIGQIKHISSKQTLGGDIVSDHSFSNKPKGGYGDYYSKMTQYAQILSHPAQAIDASIDPRTYKPIRSMAEESVFRYVDTASSRAGIQSLSERLAAQRIAIVGLGGTGAYVLDLVAKTPVKEIHLFDADNFYSHNAFRAPGAASLEQLRLGAPKVEYLAGVYSRMHVGIVAHCEYVTAESMEALAGFDYIFLCIDAGECKKDIYKSAHLSLCTIIDVGLDVILESGSLLGTCRVTTRTGGKSDHIDKRVSMDGGMEGDEYASNIQIAELNALNACFAVIKWKQLSGFYQDLEKEHHMTYSTNCALLDIGEQVRAD